MSTQPEPITSLDYRIRQALLLILYIGVVAGTLWLIHYVRPVIEFVLNVLSPFIVAMIVAYIFNPVVRLVQYRFRLRRTAGVLVAYGMILFLTASFFAVLVPILYIQGQHGVQEVAEAQPKITRNVLKWLHVEGADEQTTRLTVLLRNHLDFDSMEKSGSAMGAVAKQAVGTGKTITMFIASALSIFLGGIAFIVFVVVITFYFLLDYNRIESVVRILLPSNQESRVFALWAKIDHALGGFLRGQLIVATIVGTLYSIALMLLGMKPYAILIGFMAGFGNLVPYLGPLIGGVPAGLWVIFGDRFDGGHDKIIGLILVVAIGVAIQTIDGFLLQPRIVGRNAELHPLLVLLALLVGSQFGLGGLIIAVPTAVILRVLIKELWWDPLVARKRATANAASP